MILNEISKTAIVLIFKQKGEFPLNKGQKDLAEQLYLGNMTKASSIIQKYQDKDELYLLGLTPQKIIDLLVLLSSEHQQEGIKFFFDLNIKLKEEYLNKFTETFVLNIYSAYSLNDIIKLLNQSLPETEIEAEKTLKPYVTMITALVQLYPFVQNKILELSTTKGPVGEICSTLLRNSLEEKIMDTNQPNKHKKMKI